ncbi:hypothetical protein R6258_18215 [Halomonas sp. HP20-15]|uniref:hypothetical protein n=1 Tax=Halomonas sp. HP20-15 TaxID=3085901 RepID=UPI002981F89F|nr:hypothetical protein [Halomonas sp. HP20-15]MDW5378856.1 hypothetical protein [Halomonas sp. HP20-15]
MILSDKYRFIFLKARKVAGTSFEMALSKYLTASDIITPISPDDENKRKELGFRGAQNYVKGDRELSNHISAKACRQIIGKDWCKYEKISIVRNPWDVALSLFYYKQGPDADLSTLSQWYLEGEGARFLGLNNQQYFIDGRLAVDRFLRFEYFKYDILKLEEERPEFSGLYEVFKGLSAKAGIRHEKSRDLREVYDSHPILMEKIKQLHSYEIDRLGYSL